MLATAITITWWNSLPLPGLPGMGCGWVRGPGMTLWTEEHSGITSSGLRAAAWPRVRGERLGCREASPNKSGGKWTALPLAVWPWTSYLTSLCFSFFVCKTGDNDETYFIGLLKGSTKLTSAVCLEYYLAHIRHSICFFKWATELINIYVRWQYNNL